MCELSAAFQMCFSSCIVELIYKVVLTVLLVGVFNGARFLHVKELTAYQGYLTGCRVHWDVVIYGFSHAMNIEFTVLIGLPTCRGHCGSSNVNFHSTPAVAAN